MKQLFLILLSVIPWVHAFSQGTRSELKQDSLTTEKLLDSALHIVYKSPETTKKLLENNLNHYQLDPYFISKSKNYIGIAYDVMGNNDSALVLYNDALRIAENEQIKGLEAGINNNIGLIHWKKGNYEDAIHHYDISLQLFNQLGKTLGAANTLNNMGLIYHKMERYPMSLKSYWEARSKYRKIDNKRGESAVLMNMGAIKQLMGDIDSSFFYCREAIKLKREINDDYGLGLAYSDFANVFQKERICDSSIHYNKLAFDIFHKLKNKYHLSQITYGIGKDHMCLNELDSAVFYFLKAQKIALKKKNMFTLKNIAEKLSIIYQKQGKWKKAFDALQDSKSYSDSLYSKEKAEAIFEVQEKYESEKKNREIAEQEASIALKNERLANSELDNSRKNFWILILVVGILSIASLLLYIYRAAKRKQERLIQEKEIKVKQEQLRISKELHDNIGARLSHIISSLDIQLYKNEADDEIGAINAFAKDTMNQLRETIWAVSDKTIYYSELKQRIEHYVQQTNTISTAKISYLNDCTADFELSATKTINLFRIVQESINNALKYSQAEAIDVRFRSNDSTTSITVSDNGKGFDPEKAMKLGSGLTGMKKRAAEIDAQFTIDSSVEKGTRIQLKLTSK